MTEPAPLTGTIKFYDRARGWGFIIAPRGEVFFPERTLDRDSKLPTRGDRVTFTVGRDWAGKPCACDVKVLTRGDRYSIAGASPNDGTTSSKSA
jgi:cold shock CspA family protein